MAVPFFMLVSGFVYTKSFEKNNITTLDVAYNKNYFVKNLIRYIIPFLISFLLEFLVELYAYIKVQTGLVAFLVRMLGVFLRGGNGPGGYYVPLMVQLLFCFPILFILVKKLGLKGVCIVYLLTVFLEVLKIPYYGNFNSQYRLLLFRYFPLIAFGCYFALYPFSKKLWLLVPLGIASIILFRYTNYKPHIFTLWIQSALPSVSFIIPIFGVLCNKNSICFTPIEKIGRASYHIFLTQRIFFLVLSQKLERILPNVYIYTLLSVVVCTLVGYLFFLVESAFSKRLIR